MKLEFLFAALVLACTQAGAGETQTPVDCGDQQAYPSKTVLMLRDGEPIVFVDFLKRVPANNKQKISVVKACLLKVSKIYQGKKDIYSGVLVNGIDDTEFAESMNVYYSQKTRSVKVQRPNMPL